MIINPAKRISETKEYYFSTKLREIRDLIASGKNIINLGIGNPDLPPSEKTINKLIEISKRKDSHGYQPYKGVDKLRKAISNWLKRTYEINLNPNNEILPLIGSKEGITHISLAFLNKGDLVLVPNPGYPTYNSVSKIVEAETITYNLTEKSDWLPNFAELEKLPLEKIKIMWINYPNMPTGKKAEKAVFEKLIDFAIKHKILICHDNPYSLILNSEKPLSIFNCDRAKEVCLELNSLSKSHNMAGWRVGWLAGNKEYIETVLKVKSNVDSGTFLALQEAAIEALENPIEWHEENNKKYLARRRIVWKIFDLLKCKYSKEQQGMFVWAKVPNNISAKNLVDKLLYQANIFITPGFIFGSEGEKYLRISLCNDVDKLTETLNRIREIEPKELLE